MRPNDLRLVQSVTSDNGKRHIVSTVLLVDGSGYETIICPFGNGIKLSPKDILRRCHYRTLDKATLGHRAALLALRVGIHVDDIGLELLSEDLPAPEEPNAETCAFVEDAIKKIIEGINSETASDGPHTYKVGERVTARLLGDGQARVGTVAHVSPPDKAGRVYYNVECDDGAIVTCPSSWLRPYTPDKPN